MKNCCLENKFENLRANEMLQAGQNQIKICEIVQPDCMDIVNCKLTQFFFLDFLNIASLPTSTSDPEFSINFKPIRKSSRIISPTIFSLFTASRSFQGDFHSWESFYWNRYCKSSYSRAIFFYIHFGSVSLSCFVGRWRIIGKTFFLLSFPNGCLALEDAEHVLEYFSR